MMRISFGGYGNNLDDLRGFLNRVEDLVDFDVTFLLKEEPKDEAFHRLSTCMESCGCTGYRPKEDCPDPNCFCNKDQ